MVSMIQQFEVLYLDMVGRQYDYLINPLGAVRSTFEKVVATGADPTSFDGKDWGVPILTHSTVKWVQANLSVRFRGMIQDMLGNECYVGPYKNEGTWNSNKFTDISQFPMRHSPDTRL
ncbi:putative mini-chromosome maintenance complex-binding protein [Helianthus annuus]|nr:putative mini-chromosome maintenance complex-binding protein [Helianthus annuus]KAJ0619286.1 putative mini-chromosome maintenance complex-binding protein [Helianthus annuus]KAJ0777743.1 putative mini-chromosome maintenance complex-binding protein [Helianthus annuus]KAJ0786759.1 putative mini-chromosome maintenance complex-binding protein [Helianthus annuus]